MCPAWHLKTVSLFIYQRFAVLLLQVSKEFLGLCDSPESEHPGSPHSAAQKVAFIRARSDGKVGAEQAVRLLPFRHHHVGNGHAVMIQYHYAAAEIDSLVKVALFIHLAGIRKAHALVVIQSG